MWIICLADDSHEMSRPIFYEKKKGLISAQPVILFVCVEVLRPSQPNGVMSSAVSLPNQQTNKKLKLGQIGMD